MNACPHEPVTLRPDELEIPLPEIRTISLRKIWQKFIRNFLLYADGIINARGFDWKKKWIKRGENWTFGV